MDHFQLKQIALETIAKQILPATVASNPAAIAEKIAEEHHLDNTAEIEKLIDHQLMKG